jgi:hypothetical protein
MSPETKVSNAEIEAGHRRFRALLNGSLGLGLIDIILKATEVFNNATTAALGGVAVLGLGGAAWQHQWIGAMEKKASGQAPATLAIAETPADDTGSGPDVW